MNVVWVLLVALLGSSLLASPSASDDISNEIIFDSSTTLYELPHPAGPGEYTIKRFSYGSGIDRRRTEFHQSVAFVSKSVNGAPFMTNVQGWNQSSRANYWGFDTDAFPINGQVWYPEGQGPFPLVFIVHGNYMMERSSHVGFGYLGEMLAKRGFITVSVDENFLNGSLLRGMPRGEIITRGWLLLEHLAAWREWNLTSGHPLSGKVDLANVALIGHSRGAEAIIAAAALNELSQYPEDPSIVFDYNFGIRALISISPGDRVHIGGEPAAINNISYLLLHGSHDGDQSTFAGIRQYERIHFTDGEPHIKAAVYIHRANHNQFSTSMGTRDVSAPAPYKWLLPGYWLYNTKQLLTHDEQLQLTRTFVGAFLEIALRGRTEYVPLLQNPQGFAQWLPDTRYTTRFQNEKVYVIADFDEDDDPITTTVEGGTIETNHLAIWREADLTLRDKNRTSQMNRALYVGWNDPGASVTIRLPQTGINPGIDGTLRFSAAVAVEAPPEIDVPFSLAQTEALDLTIELATKSGVTAHLPLSAFGSLHPPEPAHLYVFRFVDKQRFASPVEVVLQTFELPLSAFQSANSSFNPEDVHLVRFRFDRTDHGLVIIDDIGFSAGK